MFTTEQHIDNLIRHIDLVRQASILLGKKLIAQGRVKFGTNLIYLGHVHDASKWSGIEWEALHAGKDIPKEKLELAVRHHSATNNHHPEHWDNFEEIPEIYIAEMACDWLARSQEFGTDFREWINKKAVPKFKIDINGKKYSQLMKFVDMLIEDSFTKDEVYAKAL